MCQCSDHQLTGRDPITSERIKDDRQNTVSINGKENRDRGNSVNKDPIPLLRRLFHRTDSFVRRTICSVTRGLFQPLPCIAFVFTGVFSLLINERSFGQLFNVSNYDAFIRGTAICIKFYSSVQAPGIIISSNRWISKHRDISKTKVSN